MRNKKIVVFAVLLGLIIVSGMGVSYAEYAIVSDLTSSGNPYGTGCSNTIWVLGIKPVISLKSNSLKSGDGTIKNPYVVE